MDFGTYYEKTISDRKIKKSEIAKKLGITRQTLSTNIEKWKAGREPSIKTIKKYLEPLGIDIKNFLKTL